MNDVKTYGPKMLCPAEVDKLNLIGNYNTQKANNLMIVFERCHESWSPVECVK